MNALHMVSFGGGGDAFREVLRGVHLLLEAPGADSAAKAYTLIAGVTRRCPERADKSVKAAARLAVMCADAGDTGDTGARARLRRRLTMPTTTTTTMMTIFTDFSTKCTLPLPHERVVRL